MTRCRYIQSVPRALLLLVVMLAVVGLWPRVAGAQPAGHWRDFQVFTFNQVDWGIRGTSADGLFSTNALDVYGSDTLEFGLPGTSGFSILFTAAILMRDFLPQVGTPGPLTADLIDPQTSPSGPFGGDVVALRINIDFSDAGVLQGITPLRFGDLRLCNLGLGGTAQLNGLSVRDVLPIANTLLGGGTVTALTIADIAPLIADLNSSFGGGFVSSFAQDHLVRGACR
jgi:hypothetical protein